ncbi:MAG: serine/threonine protein kinase [Polyangiaceae bacterium]|nr:serine/threonine protein kinase [Polyangiaceae bacterium]
MAESQSVGRYVLYDPIASGGMASVHLGRLIGPVGFSRVVAVKRLHPAYARDQGFVTMMLDEARLASRIRHPNVVPILDVVATADELLLVMEYVHGETLARLLRAAKKAGQRIPTDVGAAIVIDTLRGLHAAHETRNAAGEPMGIVHRDVSPQNIVVAADGSARLLDFGVAKAASRTQSTAEGQLKGKLGYFAPEQIAGGEVDRRVDIFAASIVAWECVTGRRLFSADDMIATIAQVMDGEIPSLRGSELDIPDGYAAAVRRGLDRDPAKRFQTAEEMASAIEAALRPASREAVQAFVEKLAGPALAARLEVMQRIESGEVDDTVAQVPVDISPDQSGKVPTLRATLSAGPEEQGTFHSALATESIIPSAQPKKGWKRGLVVALGLLAIGGVGAVALGTRFRPAPTSLADTPVSPAAPPVSASAPAVASASAAPASSPTPAPAVSSVAPTPSVAAAVVAPRPSRPPPKSPKKPKAGEPPPGVAPPPPPADPLSDQR